MGAGKTSIGKLLAKRTNKNFIDTDYEIIKNNNMSISDIFEKHGEEYFRELETKVLKKIHAYNDYIISTGGGIVLKQDNVDLMKITGLIVFLDIDINTQVSRVKNRKNRPLLSQDKLKICLEDLKSQRNGIYKDISDYIINVSNKDKITIVKDIQSNLL